MIFWLLGGIIFIVGSIYKRTVPKQEWNLMFMLGVVIFGFVCLTIGTISFFSYL
jgi:uncharacterized membrane protein HdeD (DUF308 family)